MCIYSMYIYVYMGMSGTAVGAISEFLQPPLQQPTLPAPPTPCSCPACPSLLPYLVGVSQFWPGKMVRLS